MTRPTYHDLRDAPEEDPLAEHTGTGLSLGEGSATSAPARAELAASIEQVPVGDLSVGDFVHLIGDAEPVEITRILRQVGASTDTLRVSLLGESTPRFWDAMMLVRRSARSVAATTPQVDACGSAYVPVNADTAAAIVRLRQVAGGAKLLIDGTPVGIITPHVDDSGRVDMVVADPRSGNHVAGLMFDVVGQRLSAAVQHRTQEFEELADDPLADDSEVGIASRAMREAQRDLTAHLQRTGQAPVAADAPAPYGDHEAAA
ncbi:MAG: hypothetical protein AAGA90_23715 [Actinomycetota bacterium]